MPKPPQTEPVLSIENLRVEFATNESAVYAVNGVSYQVWAGETLAVVGESGSGKSVTAQSILQLVPQPPGKIISGRVMFEGEDLLRANAQQIRKVRGKSIAMIFQDPMTSLNPLLKVGRQVSEAMVAHGVGAEVARQKAVDLLMAVGIPNAPERYDQYPHQFSGGMRQRVMIAMAIANQPKLLVCDEPTTALDVTIQAQVFEKLAEVQTESRAAMILITHDLGLVAELADRVVVMYAGQVVETAPVEDLFEKPLHPYTLGLLNSLPRLGERTGPLNPIRGTPPDMTQRPVGCPFQPRCFLGQNRDVCGRETAVLEDAGEGRLVSCHFYSEVPAPEDG